MNQEMPTIISDAIRQALIDAGVPEKYRRRAALEVEDSVNQYIESSLKYAGSEMNNAIEAVSQASGLLAAAGVVLSGIKQGQLSGRILEAKINQLLANIQHHYRSM